MVSRNPQAWREGDCGVGRLQHFTDKATPEAILSGGMRAQKRDRDVELQLEDYAVTRRQIVGSLLGVAIAAGVMAPAFGALDTAANAVAFDSAAKTPAIASFTPASADPKLAALLARTGVGKSAYRFTPSETARAGTRAVTIAVRVQSSSLGTIGSIQADPIDPVAPTVQVAPIAYNLGASVGWKRFASSGDMAGLDLSVLGNHDRLDIAKRPGVRAADHAVSGPSRLVVDDTVIDAGSFSLSRNIDLTAGSRKSDNNRLERLSNNRRDSQAVYIGTALRF